ncbi:hypothetical protein CR513_08317, partial [Mucuna pruriens]
MSAYRIVFGKTCHLLCNLAYDQAGEQRKLTLQELDKLRLEACENSRIYKQKVKNFHDQKILRKDFYVGQKVLLFNSRLKLITGKLRTRWDEPFVITNIFPNGAVQLQDEHSSSTFQVNGHQIKPFHKGPAPITHDMEIISLINAAIRGALMNKTPATARHLISNMASNTQQFRIKGPNQSQMVNEIGAASNQRLENQLTELTSLVKQLAVGQYQPAMTAKICGICTFVDHPTDMCPTLQEIESDQPEHVEAVGGFQYGKQRYQTLPFYNQQYGRQPFQPGPPQGPYAAQRAGSMLNIPHGAAGYQQPSPQYQAPSLPQ